ncbi:STAS domain-containing protein [Streptomyces sp. SP17BM10]|uniref:STAS domain-containing protein n=1 Tax=Streptomyces sp. SP17BM10 TaxID=3002530 RepID=UPI002E76CFCF|nr:STAS domain-containing protein [Streptomyces sp. SP17BM10]MEE1786850.1 STAS domain-containing protein [Streptomyces sp. SP17BM10]
METKRTTTGRTLTCDLGALAAPDLTVVDALARLRLAAARHGVRVLLLNASGPLRELLAFSGLADVLPAAPGPAACGLAAGGPASRELPAGELRAGGRLLGVQPVREAEQREEHVGVEEVGEPGDPAA